MANIKFSLASGENARQYRKTIAQHAKKTNKSTLTYKFRLDDSNLKKLPVDRQIQFNDFAQLYDIIEGVSEQSLSYYLFATVLCGFRLFSNSENAKNYALDQEYKSHLYQTTSVYEKYFTSEAVKSFLDINTKKDLPIEESFLKEQLKKFIINDKIIDETSNAILKEYKNWKTLKGKDKDIYNLIVEVITKLTKVSPTDSSSLKDFPKGSAIAFNKFADFMQPDAQINHYLAISIILSEKNEEIDGDEAKYLKNNLTTFNNNALSWLFGNGLQLFKNNTVDDLCKFYSVPQNKKEGVECLKKIANNIHADTDKFSNALRFNNFRSTFGGHIDSWVTNYIKRLQDLNNLINSIPNLVIPSAFTRNSKDFIEYVGLKRDEIEFLQEQISSKDRVESVRDSLNKMLGKNGPATENDIQKLMEYSELFNRLGAIKEQIENILTQTEDDPQSEWNSLRKQCEKEWKSWENIKKLPKINKLSGGVPKVEEELKLKEKLLTKLEDSQNNYYQKLMNWVAHEEKNFNPLKVKVDQMQKVLDKRSKKGVNAEELAIRAILHKIGKTTREFSNNEVSKQVLTWFKDNKIFKNDKDYNKFFYNRLGALYVSPFSQRNNNHYSINSSVTENSMQLVSDFNTLLTKLKNDFDNKKVKNTTSDLDLLLKLDLLIKNFYISGIEKSIPTEIAKPQLPLDLLDENPLSASLKLSLESKEVSSSVVASVFNIYKSLISGCYTALNRERFYLRTKFMWIGNHELSYCPKYDSSWMLPKRYRQNEKWKEYINSVIEFKSDDEVDIEKTFNNVIDNPDEYAELLIQLPHDWFYSMPLKEDNSDCSVTVLKLSKDNKNDSAIQSKKGTLKLNTACRLIGPSSLKSRIDAILISNRDTTISEMNLLIDQSVEQSVENGEINLKYEAPEFSLAIPLTTEIEQELEPAPFKRIVAIDQGEAGIAFAVFNLDDAGNKTADPIYTGAIRVPSFRRLISNVKKFRKHKNEITKFNQKFDSTMFNIRENVTGDICGLIVGLMKKFNAFPILEREVRNLESGSKQLQLVYKAVNAKFLYSDVEMQNSSRSAWWFNSATWQTSLLREMSPEYIKSKKDLIKIDNKFYKQLNIFPGACVRAGGTSQICSCCGRNIFDSLRKIKNQNPSTKFSVDKNGEVTIDGQIIKLYKRPNSKITLVPNLKKPKSFNSINQRADWKDPLQEGIYDIDTLKRIIKGNLRRSPKSLMSKDTSQSRYYCVFKDCEWHNKEHHADINAAINIGRRFLAEIIKKP